MIRVTIAVAVPAPLIGLAMYLEQLGFAPEGEVPTDAIATMTFFANDEREANALTAAAGERLKQSAGRVELIPQPFTPLGDEDSAADRVE